MIVGSAYVKVDVLSQDLGDKIAAQVENSLKKLDFAGVGDKAGEEIGRRMGDKMEDPIARSVRQAVSDAADAADKAITVEVGADTGKAQHDLDQLEEDAQITVNADADTGKAAVKLAWLTRLRTVTIKPLLDNKGLLAVGTALARLSGGRLVGDMFKNIGEQLANIDKLAPRLALMTSGALTAAGAVLSLVSQVGSLGVGIAQIAPIALALPGIFAGMAAGGAVLLMSMKDIKERLGDLGKGFSALQDRVSNNFWSKAEEPIRNMANKLLPVLNKGLGAVGTSMGSWVAEFAKVASSAGVMSSLDLIFKNTSKAIDAGKAGIKDWTAGFASLAAVGSGLLPRLSAALNDVGKKFNAWIQQSIDSGDIFDWIDVAIERIKELWSVVTGLGGVFKALGTAASAAGGSTLKGLADGLHSISDAMNSVQGQQTLVAVFKAGNDAMKALAPTLPVVGKALQDLVPVLSTALPSAATAFGQAIQIVAKLISDPSIGAGLNTALLGLQAGLSALGPAIAPTAAAFGAILEVAGRLLAVIGPVLGSALQVLAPIVTSLASALMPLIDALGTGLTAAISALGPLVSPLAAMFAPLGQALASMVGPILGLVGPLVSVLMAILNPLSQVINMLVGPLAAAFNAIIGPIGALISAIGSALVPLFNALIPVFGVIAEAIGQLAAPLGQMASVLGEALGTAFAALSAALLPLISMLGPLVGALLPPIMAAFAQLVPVVGMLAGVFVQLVQTALVPLVTMATQLIAAVLPPLLSLFTALLPVIVQLAMSMITSLMPVFQLLPQIFAALMPAMQAIIGIIMQLVPLLTPIIAIVMQIFAALIPPIMQVVQTLLPPMIGLIQALLSAIMPLLSIFIQLASALASMLIPVLTTLIPIIGAVISVIGRIVGVVATVVAAIVGGLIVALTAIIGAAGRVLSAISGFVSGAIRFFGDFARAAGQKVQEVIRFFSELPGKIVGALAGLAGRLASIGSQMMQGLINGITSMAGRILDAARGVIEGAINAAKSLLGIHSPSKVFREIGNQIMNGLALGITEGASKTVAALNRVISVINSATAGLTKKFGKAARAMAKEANSLIKKQEQISAKLWDNMEADDVTKNIIKALDAQGKWNSKATKAMRSATLADIVTARENLAKGIKAQTDVLEQLVNQSNQMRDQIASSITGTLDLTTNLRKVREAVTGKVIQQGDFAAMSANVASLAAKAKTFAGKLKELITKGLPPSLVQYIASLGVDKGIAVADSFLSASEADVGKFVTDFTALQDTAKLAGSYVADQMYGAGIAAQQGLVNGLLADDAKLEKAAEHIVDKLTAAVKKKLGIKSPSTVFAGIGRNAGQGLINGLDGMQEGVAQAGSNLVSAATSSAGVDLNYSTTADVSPTYEQYNFSDGSFVIPVKDLAELKDFEEFMKYLRVSVRKRV